MQTFELICIFSLKEEIVRGKLEERSDCNREDGVGWKEN